MPFLPVTPSTAAAVKSALDGLADACDVVGSVDEQERCHRSVVPGRRSRSPGPDGGGAHRGSGGEGLAALGYAERSTRRSQDDEADRHDGADDDRPPAGQTVTKVGRISPSATALCGVTVSGSSTESAVGGPALPRQRAPRRTLAGTEATNHITAAVRITL